MLNNHASLTILVDNKASRPDLKTEHGFAAWLELPNQRILFDTGKGEALFHNADALNIDLRTADRLVISHGHFDHAGGVAKMLALKPDLQIYCHRDALVNRYSNHPGEQPKVVAVPGPDRQAIQGLPAAQRHWVDAPTRLATNITITGPVPRLNDWEDTGGPFYFDSTSLHPDPIIDDMAIWLETDCGLIILTGCCHAGLCNTVAYIQTITGQSRVAAIIGGLHLNQASSERLERTAKAIKQWNLDCLAPCHCTGDSATTFLQHLTGSCTPVLAGDKIPLPLFQ